jgi:3-oxoadipate enol-lactonase
MIITANGVEMRCKIDGTSGPWIIFSNSLGCTLEMWDEQVAVLSERYRTLRYDTRGHGGSAAPHAPYSLTDLANDLIGLLDVHGIETACLVGLSMGGMLGQVALLQQPSRFSAAVLCDTTSYYGPESLPFWKERARIAREEGLEKIAQAVPARWFTQGFATAQPDVVARYQNMLRGNDPQGYAACCQAIPQINVTGQLSQLSMPVRVIVGENDLSTTVEHARKIAVALPNADLVILADAAHLSNVQQPASFNAALMEFLARYYPTAQSLCRQNHE